MRDEEKIMLVHAEDKLTHLNDLLAVISCSNARQDLIQSTILNFVQPQIEEIKEIIKKEKNK